MNIGYLDAKQVADALPWQDLVAAIEKIFVSDCHTPTRHHHSIDVPGGDEATLLLMPAWTTSKYLGVKIATVFPSNRTVNLPSIFANYLLYSGKTGEALAMLDGGELTARRTAAASVLAAKYLSRKNAKRHLMIGTGRLSTNLVQAYAQALNIKHFCIWGRDQEKSERVALKLAEQGIDISVVPTDKLEQAVGNTDILSCATLSQEPLINGQWLTPGTHVDLIGSFKPTMRETDDEVMRRGRIFVDTRTGALHESGDLVIPIASGIIDQENILADLYDLCKRQCVGRQTQEEITVFKSVGAACEDLAAAILAYEGKTTQSSK